MGTLPARNFLSSLLRLPTQETKFLWIIVGLFPLSLALSNILSTAKLVEIVPEINLFGLTIPALILSGGTALFPIMYVFSDVLTEIYGYKVCRKVIWLGFFSIGFTTAAVFFVDALPGASFWKGDSAYKDMFLNVWRINVASFMAYWVGEFLNSYVLAKLKLRESKERSNRHMAGRFVLSTALGQAADTAIFTTVAFAGIVGNEMLVQMIIGTWIFKVIWEVVALPVTIPLVKKLKEIEEIDTFDEGTDFNPLHLQD